MKITYFLSVLYLLFISVSFAESKAVFDQQSGLLHIPEVVVGSSIYGVDMRDLGGFNFEISGASVVYDGDYFSAPPQYPVGTTIHREPTDRIPYHWYVYIPRSLNKSEKAYILMTGIRAEASDDYDGLASVALGELERKTSIAENQKFIILVPHIPRLPSNPIYVAAFARSVFDETVDELLQRPDLKINAMLDQLMQGLELDGYNVHNKIFIEGHSIGGMFGNRYALLHPERVQAVASGAPGGALTLPESVYQGMGMVWPMGIVDFYELTGTGFDMDTYCQIPHFFYIGAEDQNTTMRGLGELWETQSQIDLIKSRFGETPAKILKNQSEYLANLGCNVMYKSYSGVGHAITNEMVNDYINFFNNSK